MKTAHEILRERDLSNTPVLFQSLSFNPNPSMEGKHYPVAEIIPMEDIITEWNKETGLREQRAIRYAPGEKSIYLDEQNIDVKWNKPNISIKEGILIVSQNEVLLLEYLRKSNFNIDNPMIGAGKSPMFKERNQKEDARAFIQSEQDEIDVRSHILNMKASDLEAYAIALQMKGASMKPTDELRRDMIIIAKTDPKTFMEGFNNPKVKRMYHLQSALEEGIIELNKANNSICWADSGNPIILANLSEDPMEKLLEHTFRQAGEQVFNLIKENLKGLTPDLHGSKHKETPIDQLPSAKGPDLTPKEEEFVIPKTAGTNGNLTGVALLRKAMEHDVIFKSGPWFKVKGAEKGFTNSKANAVTALEMDDSLIKEVRDLLNEINA